MLRRILPLIALFASSAAFAQGASLKSPNVSADALFLYRNSNFNKENASTERNGLDLQEAEVAYYADVDPYSRMTVILSVSPVYTQVPGKDRVTQSWDVSPEEAYVESDHVPGVTFKLGKFYAAFGKHNTLHTHAFPFVDAPLANSQLLGSEGLNDVGASAAMLLPVRWFSEVTAQYLRGEGTNTEFNSPTPGDAVGVGHWKNLWDITDELTMDVGGSYASGANSLGGNTTLAGGDLTFKWRPLTKGRYHSGILAFEYIGRAQQQAASTTEHGDGLTAWTQYQFAERWAAKARYESLQINGSDPVVNPDNALANGLTTKATASLEFDATEFSFFRLEYETLHGPALPNGLTDEHKIYLQANFTIGAHPAHSY